MPRTMRTLEQLILLRAHKVNDLSGQLSSQRQLCKRYENNIQALQSLAVSPTIEREGAAMMINLAHYKMNLQRIINWQKQEQALAQLKAMQLQQDLLSEGRREKGFQLVLDKRREEAAIDEARRMQKITDAQSVQCWLRRQRER